MSDAVGNHSRPAGPIRVDELEQHYRSYFDLFNRQLFFEAHEALEILWLPQRHGPNGAFYKGLIQLAGAFVHLQRGRPQPAASLFEHAQVNLAKYPARHERLDLGPVLRLIADRLHHLRTCPDGPREWPRLEPPEPA